MGRLLAIDYGTKRTGIAVTDPLKIIPTGLATVRTFQLMEYLKQYFQKERVECVIVGLPRQMNNKLSENAEHVMLFVKQFKKSFPDIPVEFYDERFTSVIAQKSMIESGMKKKDRQNKAIVDEISATIILQGYMESRAYKNKEI
ncbi:MAG TPA: Holliday junction resolvase RuvX [Dysgonomonas sp.]|nr:Holliday junction resolvase RuvX [Dysgonomonas sp.]